MLDFNYLLALIIVKTYDTFEQMNPGVGLFLFCDLLQNWLSLALFDVLLLQLLKLIKLYSRPYKVKVIVDLSEIRERKCPDNTIIFHMRRHYDKSWTRIRRIMTKGYISGSSGHFVAVSKVTINICDDCTIFK